MAGYQPIPFVGSGRLSDLVREQGQRRAEAELRQGEISQRMWSDLGNTIAGTISGIAKQRQDAPRLAQEQQARVLENQSRQRVELDASRQRSTTNAIDTLMQGAAVNDPETGIATYDRAKLQQGFNEAGIAHLWPQYSELLNKSDESIKALKDQHRSAIVDVARLVDASGNDATVFGNELKRGIANGLFTQQEAAPLMDAVQRDPSHISKVTAALLGKKPQLKEVAAGASLVDESNPAAGPVYTAPADPLKAATADRENRALSETMRHNKATEAHAAADEGAAPSLDPAGLDAAAKMYAQTGTLPAMGMGGKAANVRAAIINRAAALYPDLNIAANKAGYGADTDALKGLTKQREAIGAFENTAKKNIDIFLEAAGKVVDTGSPMANSLARQVSGKMLGSKDQAAYDAARQVAINEIAKITSNPNLSGTLSDSARHEVDAFNPASATLKQTVAVMRLLKQDMANRTTALDDQIAGIKGRIGGNKTSQSFAVTAPNGKTYTFPSQADADAFKAKAGIK